MAETINVPTYVAPTAEGLAQWARQAASAINQLAQTTPPGGAIYVWDKGCLGVPTNTDIDGAVEIVFPSTFAGNTTLIITGVGFEGGVRFAFNGVEVDTLSNPDLSNEISYEFHVDNMIDQSANTLNSFKIWSTTSDSGELRRLEVYRDWTRDSIDAVLQTAENALDTADGKIETYYQDDPPTADGVGDLWFDTNDGNKIYRWNGSAWVPAQDSAIAQAINDAATAQATADGKIVTFYAVSSSPPTAEGIGDLWFQTDTNRTFRWNGTNWNDRVADDADWAKVGGTGKPEDNADVTATKVINAVANPEFEAGDRDWSKGAGWTIVNDASNARNGSWAAKATGVTGGRLTNLGHLQVAPGDRILAQAFAKVSAGGLRIGIEFLDASGAGLPVADLSTAVTGGSYAQMRVDAIAPASAVRARLLSQGNGASTTGYVDGAYMDILTKNSDIDITETTNAGDLASKDQADTTDIVEQAVTELSGAYTSGTVGFSGATATTAQSVIIPLANNNGGKCLIQFTGNFTYSDSSSTYPLFYLDVYEDDSYVRTVGTWSFVRVRNNSTDQSPAVFGAIDDPPSGKKLEYRAIVQGQSSQSGNVRDRFLSVFQAKNDV